MTVGADDDDAECIGVILYVRAGANEPYKSY